MKSFLGWLYLWMFVLHSYIANLQGRDRIYSFLSWSNNDDDHYSIWKVICGVIWVEMTLVHCILYFIDRELMHSL